MCIFYYAIIFEIFDYFNSNVGYILGQKDEFVYLENTTLKCSRSALLCIILIGNYTNLFINKTIFVILIQ